jgi:16S rRNA (adenine(1408)-N(1))-methyltransferase
MIDASRRAARGGALPNALFVVAAAESLPRELDGFAEEITIHFPWGSLLRGLLRADLVIVGGLTAVTKPGASVTMLLSVTDRDRLDGLETLDGPAIEELTRRLAPFGLRSTEARPASRDDIDAAHSSWSKRLAAGGSRAVWLVRMTVPGT